MVDLKRRMAFGTSAGGSSAPHHDSGYSSYADEILSGNTLGTLFPPLIPTDNRKVLLTDPDDGSQIIFESASYTNSANDLTWFKYPYSPSAIDHNYNGFDATSHSLYGGTGSHPHATWTQIPDYNLGAIGSNTYAPPFRCWNDYNTWISINFYLKLSNNVAPTWTYAQTFTGHKPDARSMISSADFSVTTAGTGSFNGVLGRFITWNLYNSTDGTWGGFSAISPPNGAAICGFDTNGIPIRADYTSDGTDSNGDLFIEFTQDKTYFTNLKTFQDPNVSLFDPTWITHLI